jgi:hypothetical protein
MDVAVSSHMIRRNPNAYRALGLAMVVACVASCTDPDLATSIALADGRKQVLAPIESAEIVVRQSAPPQYALRITSGLPNGCAEFDRIDLIPNGSVVELRVWNTLPASEKIACTMVYGTASNTVDLAGEFESGRTYDVRINGQTKVTFTAK